MAGCPPAGANSLVGRVAPSSTALSKPPCKWRKRRPASRLPNLNPYPKAPKSPRRRQPAALAPRPKTFQLSSESNVKTRPHSICWICRMRWTKKNSRSPLSWRGNGSRERPIPTIPSVTGISRLGAANSSEVETSWSIRHPRRSSWANPSLSTWSGYV